MANEIVTQAKSQAVSSSAILPHPDSRITEAGPSTSVINRGPDNSPSEVHQPSQPLRYVESTSGSSEDEIAPCDNTTPPAPFKKSRQGKYAYSDRYDASEYIIEQLSDHDDVDLVKPWHRKLMLIHPFVIAWVFVTYAAYYGYRVWCNYQYRLVLGGLAEASWIFICVEGVILRMYSSDTTPVLAS
jgi:hypothetical protein